MGDKPGYLHGYTSEEQERLYEQARFLEHRIFESVDLKKQRALLEMGCGVGAQTAILLRRFPQLKIVGVDKSQSQLSRAKSHLQKAVHRGQVQLEEGDAAHLSYGKGSFDTVFICWLLEHVNNPAEVLKEAQRLLKNKGIIYCTEVLNSSLFLEPYSPATLQYWFQFNDYQSTLKGDPFVGAKLGNLLLEAGFSKIHAEVKTYLYDNREPTRRKEMIDFWTRLLLSGTPGLLKGGRVTESLVNEMKRELTHLTHHPDAVFFYAFIQARAVKS